MLPPVTEPTLHQGQVLKDGQAPRYRIVAQLGSGGMATIYRAEDLKLQGKQNAIKVLRIRDAESLHLFRREAEQLAQLNHPRVVHVEALNETFEDERNPASRFHYLVMEFLEGETLAQVLARNDCRPPLEVAKLGLSIAEALAVIHAKGVVHRDLKPANIMLKLSADRSVMVDWLKLIDFGLAKQNEEQSRQVMGTPEYVAPEQVQNQASAPPADLYALGVMLYEMLAGRLPFEGASPLELVEQHVRAQVPRVRAAMPDVPFELDELVFRLMQKNPADRPSAAEVARQLGKLEYELRSSGTVPAFALPAGTTQRIVRSAQRPTDKVSPPGWRVGLALVGALLVAVLIGWAALGEPPPAPVLVEAPRIEVPAPPVEVKAEPVLPPPEEEELEPLVPARPALAATTKRPAVAVVAPKPVVIEEFPRCADLGEWRAEEKSRADEIDARVRERLLGQRAARDAIETTLGTLGPVRERINSAANGEQCAAASKALDGWARAHGL